MIPSDLLRELWMKGIRLTGQGDEVAVDTPNGARTDALRQAIRYYKTALLKRGNEKAALPESLDGCPHTDAERLVWEAWLHPEALRQHPSDPCVHPARYRRPNDTLICLDCALVFQDAFWAPQPIRECTTHTPYASAPRDGPVRQCQACPAVWYDPCPCGSAGWRLDMSGDTGVWRCRACGTWYGAPPCPHPDALVHGPRTLCRVIHCGQTVYTPCSQCGSREWRRGQTSNAAWWCKNCGRPWDAAADQG
jgi:hypothetical protein